MTRALILTGGVSHDFPTSSAALIDLLGSHGIACELEEDIDRGFRRLGEERFDVLIFNTLRWRMENPKHAPMRARWGYETSELARTAIAGHLARGGGILGMHAASICFDDWPEWREILGGHWQWDISRHDPVGGAHVRFMGDNPLIRALPDFDVIDEIYTGLALADDVLPLAYATVDRLPGEHPVLWARDVGGGRVIYDALGHDPQSLRHPVHERLILRALRWVAGETTEEGMLHDA